MFLAFKLIDFNSVANVEADISVAKPGDAAVLTDAVKPRLKFQLGVDEVDAKLNEKVESAIAEAKVKAAKEIQTVETQSATEADAPDSV